MSRTFRTMADTSERATSQRRATTTRRAVPSRAAAVAAELADHYADATTLPALVRMPGGSVELRGNRARRTMATA